MVSGNLEVKLCKRFKDFQLELEFSFGPNITAISGPSGSGKSTLLDCVAGLVKPDFGSIICNQKIFFDSERKINLAPGARGCAYVLQNLGLFPHFSVAQNICYGIEHLSRDAQEQRLKELLEMVNLSGMETRRISELSGGQSQRVAIARAIAPEPSLLLMDEPFSSLDSQLKNQLAIEIKALQVKLGIPFLLVTHSTQEALELADYTIKLANGKIDTHGKTAAVLAGFSESSISESARISW